MTNRKTPIHAASRSVEAVLEIIAKSPGLKVREIMTSAGYAMSHTKNVLSWLSAHDKAFPVPFGIDRHWYLAEQAKPLLKAWEAGRDRRAEARGHGPKKGRPPCGRDKIADLSRQDGGVSSAQMRAALGADLRSIIRHTKAMSTQGRLFRGERDGYRLRWFDTAERAQEWAALPALVPSEWHVPAKNGWADSARKRSDAKANQLARQAARKAAFAASQADRRAAEEAAKAKKMAKAEEKARAKAKKLTPKPAFQIVKELPGVAPAVILKPAKAPQGVDYSRAKVTVCKAPDHDPRYQFSPRAVVVGEFSRQWQQLRGAA